MHQQKVLRRLEGLLNVINYVIAGDYEQGMTVSASYLRTLEITTIPLPSYRELTVVSNVYADAGWHVEFELRPEDILVAIRKLTMNYTLKA